jgi:type VI secretion system protein VasG
MFPDPGHTACMLQNSTRPTKGLPAPLAVELRIVVLRHYQTEMKLSEILSANLLLTLLAHPNKYGHTPYYRALSVIPLTDLKQQVEGLINSVTENKTTNHEHQDALSAYTTNYTQLAKDNKIDPVLCRDSEIRQMIDILARRRKNNPMIVGEAGVGKTALVEGLAIKIAQGEVPDILENVSLLSLDLGLLQAGASIKGEFERRLNLVIKAVQQSPTPIILFIDEAHTLIGAGGQAGSNDAANLLKPALARGELRTIGATTWSECVNTFIPGDTSRESKAPTMHPD